MNSVITLAAEKRKAKTREALHGAMLALLVEKPFEQIQILDLAGRAGVGYATFFRHYAGLAEVLDEVAGQQIRELFEMTIPAFQRSDTAASLQRVCGYVFERRRLWHPLLTGGAADRVRREFVSQAREWAARGEDEATSVPVDLGTVCVAGATIDALAWWLKDGCSYSSDEMGSFIDRLVISPFVVGPGVQAT